MDLDLMVVKYAHAKHLGRISRMNHVERRPVWDKELMQFLQKENEAEKVVHMKAWLAGYDELALDYAEAEILRKK